MEAITLYNDRLFIVAGAQNPLTRRRSIKLAELISEPWCGAPFDSFPWSLVRDAFLAARLEIPRNAVRTRSILARNGLLASGRFDNTSNDYVAFWHAKLLAEAAAFGLANIIISSRHNHIERQDDNACSSAVH